MKKILLILMMMGATLAQAADYAGEATDSIGYSSNGVHVFVRRVFSGTGDVNYIGLILTKFQNQRLSGSVYKLAFLDGKWKWYPYSVRRLSESIILPIVDDNPAYFQTGSDPQFIQLTATPYGDRKLKCLRQINAKRDNSVRWLALNQMPGQFVRHSRYDKYYDVSTSGYDWTVVPYMSYRTQDETRTWDRARFKETFTIEENVSGLGLLNFNSVTMRGTDDLRNDVDAFFALVTSKNFRHSGTKGILVMTKDGDQRRGFSCENPVYTFDSRQAGQERH